MHKEVKILKVYLILLQQQCVKSNGDPSDLSLYAAAALRFPFIRTKMSNSKTVQKYIKECTQASVRNVAVTNRDTPIFSLNRPECNANRNVFSPLTEVSYF